MVRFGVRTVSNVSGGFSRKVSCSSSEDSVTSMRGALLGDGAFCCANEAGRRRKRRKTERTLVNHNRCRPPRFCTSVDCKGVSSPLCVLESTPTARGRSIDRFSTVTFVLLALEHVGRVAAEATIQGLREDSLLA